jgi:hypothetical protein
MFFLTESVVSLEAAPFKTDGNLPSQVVANGFHGGFAGSKKNLHLFFRCRYFPVTPSRQRVDDFNPLTADPRAASDRAVASASTKNAT